MGNKIFIIVAACCCPVFFMSKGASPGPVSDFDKTGFWSRPEIVGTGADGLSTRGMMFFDVMSEVQAVDRLNEALAVGLKTGTLSADETARLRKTTVMADVLGGSSAGIPELQEWIEKNRTNPHRADMALLMADLMVERGAYADARQAYAAIDDDAVSPALRDDYLYHRAYTEMRLAEYDQAKAIFGMGALQTSAKFGDASRFYLGYICYAEGDYAGALAHWDTLHGNTMPGLMADYYRAQIAYYEGNYDKALRLSRPLLDANYGADVAFRAEVNRIVGESLYQQGERSAAIPYLRKYVSSVEMPELSAQYILGLAEYDDGDYSGAVEHLTPVTAEKSEMGQSAYLYIGQALLKTGDDSGAIMAFNRALEMNFDPEVTEVAYYNYAVSKSRGANMPFASSVVIFDDFLSRYPNSQFANDVAGYMVDGYVTDGNYESALKSIDKVKNPNRQILRVKQKVLYLQGSRNLLAGDVNGAIKSLESSRGLAEYDNEVGAETELLLGEAYYRTGRYDESASALLTYLNTAAAGAENRPLARYDLAYTRLAQRQYENAATNLERMLADPGNLSIQTQADAQTRLADIRYYMRDWQGAAEAYDKAYSMNRENGDYPLLQKAIMQGYAKDYRGKLNTLNTVESQYPGSELTADVLMEKAEAYVQLGDAAKADNMYREVIDRYGSTVQARKAYLFLASDLAGQGDTDGAIRSYEELIRRYSTSDEARLADEAVKRLHAERGSLAEYAGFVAGIEDAPSFDMEEAESLTWNAAEQAYLTGKGVVLLEKYVNDYPKGTYASRALAYLLDSAMDSDNEEDTYRWASAIVKNYPESGAVEQALMAKADIEYDRGQGMDALATWTILETKASSPANRNVALTGMMQVARETGDTQLMKRTAGAIASSSVAGADDKADARFTMALAESLEGDTQSAVNDWVELAKNPDDIYGAKAAVYAAEALNEEGKYEQAATIAGEFVNSGTPHTYWLARGFLALSDALAGQGKKFEANEYLKALKENYPGNEPDIYEMIEERIK